MAMIFFVFCHELLMNFLDVYKEGRFQCIFVFFLLEALCTSEKTDSIMK